MDLCARAARGELRRLAREGVRVRLCGRSERLPSRTRAALEQLVAETSSNRGILLNLAIDYGGRREIGDAVRALVKEVRAGVLDADSIDEHALQSRLYTAGLPDPDLIVRTGGELRLSNFLLVSGGVRGVLGYADLLAGLRREPLRRGAGRLCVAPTPLRNLAKPR